MESAGSFPELFAAIELLAGHMAVFFHFRETFASPAVSPIFSRIVSAMNTNDKNPYAARQSGAQQRRAQQRPVQQGGFVPASAGRPRHAQNGRVGTNPNARPAANPYAQQAGRPATQYRQPAMAGDAQSYSRANYGPNMGGGKHGRNGKAKRRVWTVVFVIAAIVLAISLGTLAVIGYGYWHGTQVYDNLSEQSGLAKESNALEEMTIDWDALRAQNEDIVGWVYMPGTSIDYPIVQGTDDEEYLQKDFTGDSGGLVHKGTIFLSATNDADFSDDNNFIYGHNMNDETMFAHILAMANQSEFDAARTFYILTPTQNYRCQTFAIDIVKNTAVELLQPQFADSSTMMTYMSARISDSSVAAPTDIDLASISKIFTLITCGDDYATTRAVLFGGCVEQATPTNAQ